MSMIRTNRLKEMELLSAQMNHFEEITSVNQSSEEFRKQSHFPVALKGSKFATRWQQSVEQCAAQSDSVPMVF